MAYCHVDSYLHGGVCMSGRLKLSPYNGGGVDVEYLRLVNDVFRIRDRKRLEKILKIIKSNRRSITIELF